MTTHTLKSWPEFFVDIASGAKTFELRKNDRRYRIGDILVLREWEPPTAARLSAGGATEGKYTGREVRRRICYVMIGAGVGCIEPLKGLNIGYAILGLMPTTMTGGSE